VAASGGRRGVQHAALLLDARVGPSGVLVVHSARRCLLRRDVVTRHVHPWLLRLRVVGCMCRGVSGHVPLMLRQRLLPIHYCNGKNNLSTLLIRKLMHTYSLDLHLADFRTK
jgi:hypothetical protein